MQAHDDPSFRAVVNAADLVVPDGVPMVWALRALGLPQRRRVRVAPDLLLELFVACETCGIKLGLYGGTPETLDGLRRLPCRSRSRPRGALRLEPALPPADRAGGRRGHGAHQGGRRAAPSRGHRLPQAGALDGRPRRTARLRHVRRRRRLRHVRRARPATHQRGCAISGWSGSIASSPSRGGSGAATYSATRGSSGPLALQMARSRRHC